jgi:hypothetical protein
VIAALARIEAPAPLLTRPNFIENAPAPLMVTLLIASNG